MGHVLLLPFGTLGSINPFVGLGRVLRARGHRVTMITADVYARDAEGAGLAFKGIGNAELEAMLADPRMWSSGHAARVAYTWAGRATSRYVAAIEDVISRDGIPDLMLAPMINFGARLAREKHGVPLVSVHLYPMMFVSAGALPLLSPRLGFLRRWPHWLRKIALTAPNPNDLAALPAVRKCCAEHGVHPPLSLWRQWWHSPDGVLALFPEWFAQSQPDWPHNLLQWDFPLEDLAAAKPLEPALKRFLDRGDKPIVFTAGTGQFHATSFFAVATELANKCGRRAVFVTSKREQLPAHLPDTIFHATYAPFGELLPQAQAVVHHGGIGTVAQALAAGVPQLVVAMALDQPDNGERVERLGVGISMQASLFTTDAARPLVERCVRDERMRATAAGYAQRMRTRSSAETLVTWLESRELPSRRRRVHSLDEQNTSPVYLIPGLGSDSRTFRGAWAELAHATCVEWPEYDGEMTITAYARFAADAWRIPDGAILVATSLGGAIACEIARIRALRAVVLIASSPSASDFVGIRPTRRMAKFGSLRGIQRLLHEREGIRRQRYGRDPTPFRRALLDAIEQFTVTSLPLYVGMMEAITRWPGGADLAVRMVRIHGRHDRKLRVPASADLLLDGGHLIAMSHARECVDFIKAKVLDG